MLLLRVLAFLLFAPFLSFAQSQDLTTDNKRAIKFYNQGLEEIRRRNFAEGIYYYKRAIAKDPDFSEAYLRLGSAYTILRIPDSAYAYYNLFQLKTSHDQIDHRLAFFLANLYFDYGEYARANTLMELGMSKEPGWARDTGKVRLNDKIKYALDHSQIVTRHQVELLPPEVNRFYTQYFPVITIDGKSLFYTRRRGFLRTDDEDLVVSYLVDGQWTEAVSVSATINSRYNEGACSISADGRSLIFTSCEESLTFGSCDLFIATKEGEVWSRPQNLGTQINSPFWESQPSLSADGRTLYFASNRPGGFGQRDIWVSYHDGSGWGAPRNVGPEINTAVDETTPYIHSNNRKLFFSSEGHIGFGGFDLFMADMQADSSWSRPVNLGYGINDHHDQLSLIISPDGTLGYFALEKLGEDGYISSNLAKIRFETDTLVDHRASYVTGTVRDALTDEPLQASIELYDLRTSTKEYQTRSDKVTGTYFFVLTEGNEYGAFVSAPGYLFEDFTFEVEDNTLLDPDTIDIHLFPVTQGANLVLENVYFEFDSYELSEKSISELNIASNFLKENNVSVEIAGHTDESGTDAYNKTLSINRAKAVYNYLVQSGVEPAKLVYEGYGSSQPRFTEESEKSLNRRIEFKILTVNQ